ncbi:asparagine synthase (glutamine-hydrolyzing) [Pseudalkalibacillus salsuginis]|uniref:asparagine synthase (glutamine-hydrolyzing) n=1 Tax=Pseudalkalibacillus salsuginis TaxID=2910972 RepID=UPI001F1E309A|nr:asparagine synthase (glutamine-hydrolyzing) [Pseudalkalibacillus salsuginis]MCF6409628.1 asparagine synthase (glutamine-hydrolyzing) [Pseudalkalibacillus salsuginis]
MCGFIGYMYNEQQTKIEEEMTKLCSQTFVIKHRGPDDTGFYTDSHVRFGFTRLSIIDLKGGSQPLSYENERYWIIFNGEIYNHIELRNEMEKQGLTFDTSSDTEVILALYHQNGQEAVKSLRGMFAFVIWDKKHKEIFAARDPFGIKPFFYFEDRKGIFFASEKKSLLLGEKENFFDRKALQHYLTYQFVPEPFTLSEKIKRLEPGNYIQKKAGEPMRVNSYWKPQFLPVHRPFEDKLKDIREVLRDSVSVHMRSDVPVGAFLSSGIDSTSIVAMAKEIHPTLKTFSVGFEMDGYNEADFAAETAEKLGVENHRKMISSEEFVEELPKIIWHMDEPVADPAAVPLYFVAKEASKHVKVVLSGEGADELFGGYNIYREPLSLKWFSYLNPLSKKWLKEMAVRLPNDLKGKNYLIRGCTPIEERYIGNAKMFSEQEKSQLLERYNNRFSYMNVTHPLYNQIRNYHDVTKMQYIDLHTWLPGDILVKADKMTMAHSLELRVPFLDKEVFQAASQLSVDDKTGAGMTKYAFRKAMEGIVPDSVLYRKKLGFPVPIRHWLKDELYDWAYQLIKESKTSAHIRKDYVFKLLEDHRKGNSDHSRKIWTVLMFMLWHQIYIEEKFDIPKITEFKSEERIERLG